VDNIHALHNLAKHNMFVVQEGRRHCGDEELATVSIWSGVLPKKKKMLEKISTKWDSDSVFIEGG
jgi:hypothetical protein